MRRWSRSSGVRVAVLPVLVALAVAAVFGAAGCARSNPYRDFTAPGAVPFGPNGSVLSTPPSQAATGPVRTTADASRSAGAARAPTAPAAAPAANEPWTLGRPMTTWEKQYRQQCQQNIVQNGCKFFSDDSLELQGINPFS